MSIEEIIGHIMDNYMPVRSISNDNKYKFDKLVRVELVHELLKLTEKYNNLKIKGHTRVSRWADIPWIGIGDDRIDHEPMTGIYIAILIRADGNELYLSIQHGTDKLSIDEIKSRVSMLRENNHLKSNKFSNSDLKIKQTKEELGFQLSRRSGKYEIANILGKNYLRENISDIKNDILELIEIYTKWVNTILDTCKNKDIYSINEEDEVYFNNKKDRKLSSILKVPPNSAEAALAFKNANNKCEIDEDHETFIKDDKEVYLESHHLIPMKYYKNFDNSIDNHINIYALCPLCHRRIHYGKKEDRFKMVETLYNKRKNLYKKYYYIDLNKLKLYYDKNIEDDDNYL